MSIRVFIVDDSAVVRQHLTHTLSAAGITVTGSAADPLFAWPKMQADWPDVLVLDVEMPRMDGIEFLKKVMRERPLPVVMCSTLTERGCETTMQALAAGAVSFVTKPRMGLRDFLQSQSNGLVEAVRAAARANVKVLGVRAAPPARPAGAAEPVPASTAMSETTDRIVAIGLSTGGVQAIEVVLRGLDRTSPGIVVVQHMPEKFTAAFAARLNNIVDMEVKEAAHGDRVLPGRVLIAPGGRHTVVRRSGAQYVVDIKDGPLVSHHRPSVDVMLRSVAASAGRNALGIVMTGMGDDGARGLRDLHATGAWTAVQDEASCVVFGMPAEALRLGAADEVVALDDISAWIRHACTLPLRGPETPQEPP